MFPVFIIHPCDPNIPGYPRIQDQAVANNLGVPLSELDDYYKVIGTGDGDHGLPTKHYKFVYNEKGEPVSAEFLVPITTRLLAPIMAKEGLIQGKGILMKFAEGINYSLKYIRDFGINDETIVALGAYSSVVSGRGLFFHKEALIPKGIVTITGGALAVGFMVQNLRKYCFKHRIHKPRVMILGATGTIGKIFTEWIVADKIVQPENILGIARNQNRLLKLSQRLGIEVRSIHEFDPQEIQRYDIVVPVTDTTNNPGIPGYYFNNVKAILDVCEPKFTIYIEDELDFSKVDVVDCGLGYLPPNYFYYGMHTTYPRIPSHNICYACELAAFLRSVTGLKEEILSVEGARQEWEAFQSTGGTLAPIKHKPLRKKIKEFVPA